MWEFPSFIRLNNILLYTTFCLTIHLYMNTSDAPTCWLLWIVLLWTWVYKHLFKILISTVILFPEVGLLDHVVTLFFNFGRNHHTVLFPVVAAPFYFSTNSAHGFCPLPPQYLLLLFSLRFFFHCSHFNGCVEVIVFLRVCLLTNLKLTTENSCQWKLYQK